MDTYPSYGMTIGSVPAMDDGLSTDITYDGAAHVRGAFPVEYFNLTINHSFLTLTERNAVRDFFTAHRGQIVLIAWPTGSESYQGFLLNYSESQPRSGMHWDVRVMARGVRA